MQDCGEGDYERWTPLSPTQDCLLGQKWSMERRKRDARCFNGRDREWDEVHKSFCECESVWALFALCQFLPAPDMLAGTSLTLLVHDGLCSSTRMLASLMAVGLPQIPQPLHISPGWPWSDERSAGLPAADVAVQRQAGRSLTGALGMQVDVECEFGFERTAEGCVRMAGIDADQCGELSSKGYLTSSTNHRLVHGDECTNVSRVIPDTNGHGGLPESGSSGRGGSGGRGHAWLLTAIIILVSPGAAKSFFPFFFPHHLGEQHADMALCSNVVRL